MLSRPVIVPVNLGCCPESERCLLCPPPDPPTPALVRALIEHYRSERADPEQPLRVGFYGGPPPDDALLDAIGGLPFSVRVRPDLLSRAEARRLVARGAVAFELDACTLVDPALKAAGRHYRGSLVLEMLRELGREEVGVGVVLTPGLPRLDHAASVRDARAVAPLVDTARIHPVLVIEGARLQEAHVDGRYRPLSLGEAVTTARAMLDVLESEGVEVIRVGVQAGPDGLGRALAGPRHPSLRQLVESRRALVRLRELVEGVPPGADVTIRCAPADETRTRGPLNQHIRDLRAQFALHSVRIEPDEALPRGRWRVELGRSRR